MPYEKRANSGIISNNDRKQSDNHPDMTGSVNVNGVDMWISGWWKKSSRGEFLSLAFKPKDNLGTGHRPPVTINKTSGRPYGEGETTPKRDWEDDIDEIPF